MERKNDGNPQNYLHQLNAFHRWLDAHYLPPAAQLLWFKLIALFNGCGWPQWVQADNLRLMVLIGAGSEKAAVHARDALVQAGLLEYVRGVKGCPNRYRMRWFGAPSDRETDRENDRESAGQDGDLNKQEINQTKREKNDADVPPALCDAFTQYENMRKKSRRPMTAAAKRMALAELEKLAPGDPAKQCEILNRSVMNGWFGLFPLPAGQNEDADRPPASYDIEEIERRLLYGKIEYKKSAERII